MPAKLKDGFNCLRFEIVIEGGNTQIWMIAVPVAAGVVLVAAGIAIGIVGRKKKKAKHTEE